MFTCLEQPLTSDEVQICIQRLEGYLSVQPTDSHDLSKQLSAKSILASSEACHMLHIHSNKYWTALWFVFTLNSRRLFYISPYCFASIVFLSGVICSIVPILHEANVNFSEFSPAFFAPKYFYSQSFKLIINVLDWWEDGPICWGIYCDRIVHIWTHESFHKQQRMTRQTITYI